MINFLMVILAKLGFFPTWVKPSYRRTYFLDGMRWGDWRKNIHFLHIHTWLPMYPLYFPDGSANGLRCMYCKHTRKVAP